MADSGIGDAGGVKDIQDRAKGTVLKRRNSTGRSSLFTSQCGGIGYYSKYAEKYLDQRVTYENQLSVLEEITQENIQTKQKKLEKLELNALEIKKQLIIYESCFNDLLKEAPLPNSASGLEDLYQQIKQTFIGTNKAFDNADSELKSAQSNLEKFKNNQFEDESNSKVIESQLNDLKQNISIAKKDHENKALLKIQINSLKNQIQKFLKGINHSLQTLRS